MARLEYKYLVPLNLLSELRGMILPHVERDPYSAMRPGNEYTVRSLYLDTSRLNFYHEKLEGLKVRKKLRIRGYNEYSTTAPVFLEIKKKTGMAITKQRSALPYQNLLPLLETGEVEKYISALPEHEEARYNARRFLFYFHKQALRPSVAVMYEREAFFFKFDRRLRITFDKNLRAENNVSFNSLFREAPARYALPNHFILEIKTNSGIPTWLRLILSRLDLNQEALSKYVICAASCLGLGDDPKRVHFRAIK
jgi:hypothetical protein